MPSLEAAGAEATDKSVAPGSGWTGPRRRRRPLTAINPTHHGRRSGPGTGPAPSGEQKLRNGGGDGSNFLALTLTFPTSEQATFKKKKKKSPHRTVQRLQSENSARSSTRHHRLLLRLRLLPRRTRSGWRRRQRRRRRRRRKQRQRRLAPPLAPRWRQRRRQRKPRPRSESTNRLKGPLGEQSTYPIRT